MILHFITDDKFSDYAIRQFAGDEMCSKFILVSNSSELKYTSQVEYVKVVNPDSEEFSIVLNTLSQFKAVVLHGMFWPWEERIIEAIPDGVKLGWVFWGGEIYGRSDLVNGFLAPKTKCMYFRKKLSRWIKSGFRIENKYEIPKKCFRRIDYCLTDVHEDFLFAQNFIGGRMKELWYNYYSVEETVGGLYEARCSGDDVLLGNSCSIEGNHLDMFDFINRVPSIKAKRLYAPLSYGEVWLRNVLSAKGKALFPDFHPLVDFIPRDEYNGIIQRCSTVVMNHYRQQAFGNILTSLWLGARVFMSKNSLLYEYFKRIGCSVFCVEDDLNVSNSQLNTPLSSDELEITRSAIFTLYSKEAMRQRIIEAVNELDS